MRQDNRGVSLIEIIIAITILVICAVPLFKSMILSSQMNTKSRQLLAATNTAEAVMENLKADGLEEFIQKNQGNTNIAEVSYLDENNKEAGYRFFYPEYQMDKQKFSVEVEVKPYVNEDENKDYNTKDVANIYRMNRTTDAIYTEEEETAAEYFMKAVTKGEFQSKQREEVLSNLEVEYYYDISAEYDISEEYDISKEKGRQRVEQTVSYTYHDEQLGDVQLGENLTLLYDSNQTRGTLYNLYIFFQPGKKNVITINNPGDYPLEVYLIKQGNDEMKDLTVNLCGTKLLQNLGEEQDPDFTKGIRLRTNFKSPTDKIVYSYKGKGVQWNNLTDAELEKYFSKKYLDDTKPTYRLYDVKIEVMKDEKQITTLTGTVTR